jgi:hypothetical protein
LQAPLSARKVDVLDLLQFRLYGLPAIGRPVPIVGVPVDDEKLPVSLSYTTPRARFQPVQQPFNLGLFSPVSAAICLTLIS